jgi:hypothetical protein
VSKRMRWDRPRRGWAVWEAPGKFEPVPVKVPGRRAVKSATRANARAIALIEAQWAR